MSAGVSVSTCGSPWVRAPQLGIGLCLLLSVSTSGCQSREKFLKDHPTEFGAATQVLASPPTPAQAEPCGDIAETQIGLAYAGGLKRLTALQPGSREDLDWTLNSGITSRGLQVSETEFYASEWEQALALLQRKHVVVVWARSVEGASVESSKRHESPGSVTLAFSPGHASGVVAIHELPSGRAICWKGFVAQPAEQLDVSSEAAAKREADSSLAKAIRQSAVETLGVMAPKVTVAD